MWSSVDLNRFTVWLIARGGRRVSIMDVCTAHEAMVIANRPDVRRRGVVRVLPMGAL